ncbi:MAG: Uncharacterised protein [Flavobacteriaceae bacterium]|nr:MAG: Uncharacterised protein [Flavobacteriaceae bacterium]
MVVAAGNISEGSTLKLKGKSKVNELPPSGEAPPELLLSTSSLAITLLPLVMVYSGPGTPSVSCHPKGEASWFAGSITNISSPWFGLSKGTGNTL